MAYKQLGSGVSHNPEAVVAGGGSFTAEDHSWESVVFQYNKPVLDWELNLHNEICGPYGLGQHLRRTMPSGFLSGSFYEFGGESGSGDFSFYSPAIGDENKLSIAAADLVVNGWPIRFEFSDTSSSGTNLIQLDVPPGSGSRTDAVILEVWRALVLPDSPDHKSPSGQVFVHGNAKASDIPRNLADDLTDPTYLQPTQARVQIQYRYRVVPGVSYDTYPELPDQIEANTSAYWSGSGVDGVGSTYIYGRVDGDSGLWRAGLGDSTSAGVLGTVDGYIYAIPLCAVFRRNSTSFDKASNVNGGALIAAVTSDRPDGLFSDQIVAGDAVDLRKAVATDFQEALSRNFSYLMRDELASNGEIMSSGCAGTSMLVQDKLESPSNRATDGVRFNFSDRATIETIMTPGALPSTGGPPHTVVDFDLTTLDTPWGAVDLTTLAPVGTAIVGILRVWIDIPSVPIIVDGFSTNAWCYVTVVNMTDTHVTLNLNDLTGGAAMTFYVELEIAYPEGGGAFSRIPLNTHAVWVPFDIYSWVDPSTVAATSDVTRQAISTWSVSSADRGLKLWLQGASATETFRSPDGLVVWVPRRLDGSAVTIDDGTNPPYASTSYTADVEATVITLDFAISAGDPVDVTYVQLRSAPPLPGSSCEVFHTAKAFQSVKVPPGVQSMQLRVRAAPSRVTAVTVGTASPDDMLPAVWATGFFQIPIATGDPESDMSSSVSVQLSTADPFATGHAGVPVSYDTLPEGQIEIQNNGDATQDADQRNFWPRAGSETRIFSSISLSSDSIRKDVYPVLMEVVSTSTDSVRPGTLVLAAFTEIKNDTQPSVSVNTVPSSGCVAVYRTRGNLMNPRRSTP